MLKNGEGGGWWLGEDSLDLIGIRDALWQAANTARGAQDKANGELMLSGKEKGKKRKGKERKGERMGKLEISFARKDQQRRSHHRLGKPRPAL
jgi:hypothetical protein